MKKHFRKLIGSAGTWATLLAPTNKAWRTIKRADRRDEAWAGEITLQGVRRDKDLQKALAQVRMTDDDEGGRFGLMALLGGFLLCFWCVSPLHESASGPICCSRLVSSTAATPSNPIQWNRSTLLSRWPTAESTSRCPTMRCSGPTTLPTATVSLPYILDVLRRSDRRPGGRVLHAGKEAAAFTPCLRPQPSPKSLKRSNPKLHQKTRAGSPAVNFVSFPSKLVAGAETQTSMYLSDTTSGEVYVVGGRNERNTPYMAAATFKKRTIYAGASTLLTVEGTVPLPVKVGLGFWVLSHLRVDRRCLGKRFACAGVGLLG
jgi:hypothetical protein